MLKVIEEGEIGKLDIVRVLTEEEEEKTKVANRMVEMERKTRLIKLARASRKCIPRSVMSARTASAPI